MTACGTTFWENQPLHCEYTAQSVAGADSAYRRLLVKSSAMIQIIIGDN